MRADSDGRVLVVEDDPEIREAIRGVLEDEGYEVATAENGAVALERLQELGDPCVILLDLMMPVMDGEQFLTELRSTDVTAAIPVVVVSAWGREAAALRDVTQGFLRKPVALDVLLEEVGKFCKAEA